MIVFQFATMREEQKAPELAKQIEAVSREAIIAFAAQNPQIKQIVLEETGKENPKNISKPEASRILQRIYEDKELREEYKKVFIQKANEMGYDGEMLWKELAKQQERKMEFELAKNDMVTKAGSKEIEKGDRNADNDYKGLKEKQDNEFLRRNSG